jgi:co-chaperonin GroES (HSP10)
MDVLNRVEFGYGNVEEAFPTVDPLVEPTGSRILVQIRTPKQKTKGGVLLVTDAKDTEFWATQIGVVRAVGPNAYRDRKTNDYWPEGAWCKVGDFIRVPKFGGDRWTIPVPGQDYEALMVIFNDTDITGIIPGGWESAAKIKAFI